MTPFRATTLVCTTITAAFLTVTHVGADDEEPHLSRFETGDPRGLDTAALRTIRNALMRVHVPRDGDLFESRAFHVEPFTSESKSRQIARGEFRAGFNSSIDDYILRHEATALYELGLRAWTAEFTGGPLRLWWEVEKQGEVDTRSMFIGTAEGPGFMENASESGRMLFWYLPGASEQQPTPLGNTYFEFCEAHGIRTPGIPFVRGLQVVDAGRSEHVYMQPRLGPHLWSDWRGVKFTRHSLDGQVAVEGPTLLLDLEAQETNASDSAESRRLRMKLMAQTQKRKQENIDFGFPTVDTNSPEYLFDQICDTWRFPKSDGNNGGGGAAAYADEEARVPVLWIYTWRTSESFAEVWNFYADRCGHAQRFDPKSFGFRSGTHDDARYAIDDRLKLPEGRLLNTTFLYNAPDYVATVVLFPPDERGDLFIRLTIASRTH